MYEMKEDQQGNPQIKNGTGNWMTPVMLDDQFFTSSKAVAKKMKTSSGFVSTALSNGGKVKGKEVRRATADEIRENVKVNEPEPPVVYRVRGGQVEMKGERGHWGKVVVYNQGLFTVPELAEELEVDTSSAYDMVRRGDVDMAKAEDMPDDAIRVYPTPDSKPRENKASKAAVKREKEKKEAKKDAPFLGVRWPNGSVEVRFADGRQFMTRDSDKDLPDEVRKLTRWM